MTTRRVRHVWQGFDANVKIYLEDESGNRISGGPVVDYCYWQDANINGTLPHQRREATGRARLKITKRMWTYDANVSHMYFSKSDELRLADIFNRRQALQFELECDDPAYSGVSPYENDTHTLKTAHAVRFTIQGEENGIINASAEFQAEEFDGDFT